MSGLQHSAQAVRLHITQLWSLSHGLMVLMAERAVPWLMAMYKHMGSRHRSRRHKSSPWWWFWWPCIVSLSKGLILSLLLHQAFRLVRPHKPSHGSNNISEGEDVSILTTATVTETVTACAAVATISTPKQTLFAPPLPAETILVAPNYQPTSTCSVSPGRADEGVGLVVPESCFILRGLWAAAEELDSLGIPNGNGNGNGNGNVDQGDHSEGEDEDENNKTGATQHHHYHSYYRMGSLWEVVGHAVAAPTDNLLSAQSTTQSLDLPALMAAAATMARDDPHPDVVRRAPLFYRAAVILGTPVLRVEYQKRFAKVLWILLDKVGDMNGAGSDEGKDDVRNHTHKNTDTKSGREPDIPAMVRELNRVCGGGFSF